MNLSEIIPVLQHIFETHGDLASFAGENIIISIETLHDDQGAATCVVFGIDEDEGEAIH